MNTLPTTAAQLAAAAFEPLLTPPLYDNTSVEDRKVFSGILSTMKYRGQVQALNHKWKHRDKAQGKTIWTTDGIIAALKTTSLTNVGGRPYKVEYRAAGKLVPAMLMLTHHTQGDEVTTLLWKMLQQSAYITAGATQFAGDSHYLYNEERGLYVIALPLNAKAAELIEAGVESDTVPVRPDGTEEEVNAEDRPASLPDEA